MARPKKNATSTATVEKPAKEPKQKKLPQLQIDDYDSLIATSDIEFIHSGCTPLDCVLGGGWALGRMSTIEGGSSSGKTGIAVEAMANFHRKYPDSPIWYHDSEAAFDKGYAKALGLPHGFINYTAMPDRMDIVTLEDYFSYMRREITKLPDNKKGFAVLDSVDAMISKAEIDASIEADKKNKTTEQAGFAGAKRAAVISTGLRELIVLFFIKNIHWMWLMQQRANVGGFGNKASGGNAIKFYRSQAIKIGLDENSNIMRTIQGNIRQVGIRVKAVSKKSKVGLPYRECRFNYMFFYGIDDILACLDWVNSQSSKVNYVSYYGQLAAVSNKEGEVINYTTDQIFDNLLAIEDYDELLKVREYIRVKTRDIWNLIDSQFLPGESKYGGKNE